MIAPDYYPCQTCGHDTETDVIPESLEPYCGVGKQGRIPPRLICARCGTFHTALD